MNPQTATESRLSVQQPWTEPYESVLDRLDVDAAGGLAEDVAARRLEAAGPNRLREVETKSAWRILFDQFKSLVVLLLLAAAAVSLVFGEWVDAIAIGAVVVINASIGFFTELRAVRSMEALREMGAVSAKVRRGGSAQEIPAEELVPGDIVLLEGGDIIAADLRLIEASRLQTDESALTGESTPVGKQAQPVEADAPLAERASMVFKGSAVTAGAGEGVVTATGMDTELGAISQLVQEAESERTPLEKRLDQLGRRLVWITLVVAAAVAVMGIVRQRELLLMVETSIALAVAAIPEGLPIVATIALARGMRRMAQRNALINKLAAVETLGGTQIICTDKTGTLTENQMTVVQYALPSGRVEVSGEGLETTGEFRIAAGAGGDNNGGDNRGDDRGGGDEIVDAQNGLLRRILVAGVLCNDAALPHASEEDEPSGADGSAKNGGDKNGNSSAGRDADAATGGQPVGDPLEVALLVAGAKAGLFRDELLEAWPEVREVAFDPAVNMMATFHESAREVGSHAPGGGSAYRVAVKGAPESVLEACTSIAGEDGAQPLDEDARRQWLDRNTEMAEDGLRMLALADKETDSKDDEPYEHLVFLGLVALLDPPRSDVEPAIADCRAAGIRVVMVTGDQAATARAVAKAVGLADAQDGGDAPVVMGTELRGENGIPSATQEKLRQDAILARVSPEQKLDLIDFYQQDGRVVAMTGDGVNDAPALKKADIGIAMGRRGTQVAREASDMVLQDDAFATIVQAVEQGRAIFQNIRKFVLYLLSCNMSEILTVGIASLLSVPLPILPLQILFLNLVTDVFPALALGVGEGDPEAMSRPPRKLDEPILTRSHWALMGMYGGLLTAAVLASMTVAYWAIGLPQERAVTISFLTLAFAQLAHVFNMRETGSGLLRNEITENVWVWAALALCVGLLLVAVYVPPLANILSVVRPSGQEWALILGLSLVPLVIGQILKALGVGKI